MQIARAEPIPSCSPVRGRGAAPAAVRPAWADALPFPSRFVEVGDARLHYVDEGTGPTLLMLPGSPTWSFLYRDAIRALRDRFRCVALDLPGLGLSTAPLVRGEAFAHNAELIHGFVRSLGLERFTLVVHATAGPSALEMAMRERARVQGLVISNTFAWPLDDAPRLRAIVRVVSSRPFGWLTIYGNLLPRLTARLARRTGRFSPAERTAILGPYRTRSARRHLVNLLRGVRVERPFFAQVERRLELLRDLPTLLLYGAHDNGYRAGFLERWKATLPRHRAVVLPEAGHFPLEDAPGAWVRAVEDWWDDGMSR